MPEHVTRVQRRREGVRHDHAEHGDTVGDPRPQRVLDREQDATATQTETAAQNDGQVTWHGSLAELQG
ncbi:hypothetical protein OG896_35915 [Streptomyces sp. NBC_00669]|uniref:hypothetical protein n=1 Tax=Streptomyces sp. NBC_00669 TaxID=2976011 RepID=UPI002E376042|nr:hypothetical protein [Streptomyces sp. NBC_00669]